MDIILKVIEENRDPMRDSRSQRLGTIQSDTKLVSDQYLQKYWGQKNNLSNPVVPTLKLVFLEHYFYLIPQVAVQEIKRLILSHSNMWLPLQTIMVKKSMLKSIALQYVAQIHFNWIILLNVTFNNIPVLECGMNQLLTQNTFMTFEIIHLKTLLK